MGLRCTGGTGGSGAPCCAKVSEAFRRTVYGPVLERLRPPVWAGDNWDTPGGARSDLARSRLPRVYSNSSSREARELAKWPPWPFPTTVDPVSGPASSSPPCIHWASKAAGAYPGAEPLRSWRLQDRILERQFSLSRALDPLIGETLKVTTASGVALCGGAPQGERHEGCLFSREAAATLEMAHPQAEHML